MTTILELQDQIITNKKITRSDIQLALSIYNDKENAVTNLTEFLNGCELSQDTKDKILDDIRSYSNVE